MDFEAIIAKVSEFVAGIDWEEVIATVKGIIEKVTPYIEELIGSLGA